MILLLLVGIVVLLVGDLRVTHSFRLTGSRARLYGATLILLALPVTFLSRLLGPPVLSALHFDNVIGYRISNLVVLATTFILPALAFSSKEPTAESQNETDRKLKSKVQQAPNELVSRGPNPRERGFGPVNSDR